MEMADPLTPWSNPAMLSIPTYMPSGDPSFGFNCFGESSKKVLIRTVLTESRNSMIELFVDLTLHC